MLRYCRLCVMSLLALTLTACQIAPRASVHHAQAVWGRDSWQLSGVISIKKEQHLSFAHYRWKHTANRDVVELFGTFHLASATLTIMPHKATLVTSDGKHYVAHSAQALVREHFGWYVPIHALPFWMQGKADPKAPISHLNRQNGNLWSLTQWGWGLHWRRYHRVDGEMLPGLVTLQKGKWEIRMSVAVR